MAKGLVRAVVRVCIAFTIALFAGTIGAASWKVSVHETAGLPTLAKGGAEALKSSFAFWGKNWAWANQSTRFEIRAPFEYSVTGSNSILNFDLSAQIRKAGEQRLLWEFDLDAKSATAVAIGGGITFRFDLATFGPELGEPELLPNHRGWTWGRKSGSRIEMIFDPPLTAVYFERGRKDEIRAFFYQGDVPAGRRHFTARLDISADMHIDPTITERYGQVDLAVWPADIVDWKTSPVDLSFLNAPEKPAGKRGWLKAVKDKLVFEDGTQARFWGTNLTAYALFGTPKEAVIQQARRLSELGFNLVRLHHHDSPWVSPNIFGDRSRPDTQHLDSAMLDKLDWWIKCLKDEGIYIWLDLHVQRNFKPGDGIDNYEEIAKGKPAADLKGYNYINRSIVGAMKRFNEAYVTHGNNYTGLRYKDDPAIIAMLITNENDITHHFGNALLPDKKVPKHNAAYMGAAESFAASHGLPKDRTWRSWEHGPSKLFLNDLEYRFNAEMIAHLRGLGVKALIATTSTWGGNPLSSLPALTAGDLVDVHSYGQIGELEKNPLFAPNLVHWIAAAQAAGRPLSVSEWNVESFPAPDRHAIPLYIAAAASLQGWDALMQYAYSQVPLNGPGGPSNWHAYNDPSLLATLPAAALMYRQGHVQEATTTYVVAPGKEQLFNQAISPSNSKAIRTASEKGKLVIALPQAVELPWLARSQTPDGAKFIGNPNQSFISSDALEAVSDTGELHRNWENGIYTINTPRTQVAMGWIGGQKISLTDVGIAAITSNATVAVQALDGNPIEKSKNILISLGSRATLKSASSLPFHSEPVEGQLIIRAPAGLKLYRYSLDGLAVAKERMQRKNDSYVINIDKSMRTYWMRLM